MSMGTIAFHLSLSSRTLPSINSLVWGILCLLNESSTESLHLFLSLVPSGLHSHFLHPLPSINLVASILFNHRSYPSMFSDSLLVLLPSYSLPLTNRILIQFFTLFGDEQEVPDLL
ncbi:UNVERIFIED_CONTAM: hypothetical protein RMT77_015494 [Armadillidium vulgare]